MILEHVEIKDFRGISFLSLPFKHVMLLIGENSWGKSTLLDALTVSLSPAMANYRFTTQDFHQPQGAEPAKDCHILLSLRLQEDMDALPAILKKTIMTAENGHRQIRFGLYAEQNTPGLQSVYRFPDFPQLSDEDSLLAAEMVRRLCPVLRFRDARFSPHRVTGEETTGSREIVSMTDEQLSVLAGDLSGALPGINHGLLYQALETLFQLAQHYFQIQTQSFPAGRNQLLLSRNDLQWQQLSRLNRQIAALPAGQREPWLPALFTAIFRPQPGETPDPQVRPLLLLEDPETRLHPMMLSITWQFLALLPLQKIVTTNSAELLSMAGIEHICRLDRRHSVITGWQISAGQMPADDLRKITFHIQVNRPSALFARCWLLVEGETEVWMMNELARQSGVSLTSEGIRVVEFAQAGLKPLLKFARLMGIQWHVLTDGDDAGNKYAAVARSQLREGQSLRHHLTSFPARDIEHYFYREGFSDVYRNAAQLPPGVSVNAHKVITRAIQRSSKPSLAIAVASEAAERGVQSIPVLLRKMSGRVRGLATGKYS